MSALTLAIDQGQWELVALCLAIGLMEIMSRMQPESIIVLGRLEGGKGYER